MSEPIDNDIRKIAVSEQNKNIVVTAGAGTGKTTLLVDRMLHMLLGHKRFQTEESPILRIVAMTFTEKASCDMKTRLMRELETIVNVINGNASGIVKENVEEFLSHIRDTYQTTYSEIERRARKSLEDMDKAIIGTIHSFAAHILRLYPIESGVVPGFVVDEGDIFDELFNKEWATWLDTELALNSPNAHIWKNILIRLDLESVKGLAKRLSGFNIPPHSLHGNKNKSNINFLIDPLLNKMHEVIPHCEKPGNNLLAQLHELLKIFKAAKKQGVDYLNNLEYDADKKPSEAKTGWTPEGFEAAQELVKECHSLLRKLKTVDEAFIKTAVDLVSPFTQTFRQAYLSQGYISFDGLLTITRDLLQNSEYRYIRNKLKNDFRAILLDEFQDTDPVQYETVLFLSEALGHYCPDARKVILEPGKLFIVGDPKQSIYAFRRADIEAYEQVVKQVCDQGEILKLQENFRSHSGIIDIVNQLFDGKIMVEQPGLQPRYIPIHAGRSKKHPSQKVEIVTVSDQEGKELNADDAREAEAEWIVRWIKKNVDNELIEDTQAEKGPRKLKFRDIALLLRAFTQVRPYVEAFKRYGIAYIVEGEKYFYTTQEILDFMNLLRILENPHDTIALVGVLRSPIVGLTDREIYEVKINHLLDYRRDISSETPIDHGLRKKDKKTPPLSPDPQGDCEGVKNLCSNLKTILESFYNFLRETHARAGIIPVSQLIAEILNNSHVAEITASAWHGEQKLANLWKLYQMACDMEQTEGVSLKTFIERIKLRIKEARDEGESPLSDETLDVVKILTIHKSKGLEFPVVILGNLHGEIRNDNEVLDSAVFDWSTSTTGIVIGKGNMQIRNLQSIAIEKKLNARSWEEEKRILYVAMTRARERLILTGALKDDNKSYMGLITQSIRDAAGVELGDEAFTNPGHTKEDENVSPSPNPPHQGRGNSGDPTSRRGDKISEEDKTDKEKFPLPLREWDRVRGVSQGKFPLGNAEVFVEHFRFDGTHRPARPPKEKKLDADWTSFVETWKRRKEAMDAAARTALFTSPSAISRKEAIPGEPIVVLGKVEKATGVSSSSAAIVGSVCHRVLEGWDFRGAKEGLEKLVDSAIKWALTNEKINGGAIIQRQFDDSLYQRENHSISPHSEGGTRKVSNSTSPFSPPSEGGDRGVVAEPHFPLFTPLQIQDTELIRAEVIKILSDFIGSEAYRELQDAEILGREVPILLKWNGQIMRGTIDILYKADGRIIIADYKTDRITPSDIAQHAEKYRRQKEVYIEAVKRCLQIDNPKFKLIFLRIGKAVSI